MVRHIISGLAAFVFMSIAAQPADAHNSIAFGAPAARCGGTVMCSTNGTGGYAIDGRGHAFKFSTIKKWFQVDIDGRSHLKGQLAEPDGARGSFLVVNDTPRPIKGFALILTDDFSYRTPSVHACGAKFGKLCDDFKAGGASGTFQFTAELGGRDWNRCISGKPSGHTCVGSPAAADFVANKVSITWSAKRGGEIPSGAVFRIDFSGWNCNAAVEPLGSPSVVMISVDSNGNPGNNSSTIDRQYFTPDGQNVAFGSDATNLPGASGSNATIYIYNRPANSLTAIPTTLGRNVYVNPTISDDATVIGYSGTTEGNDYIYDTTTQTTTTLSTNGLRTVYQLLSGDGRYFIYHFVDDSISYDYIWVYDRQTATSRQMLLPDGSLPNNNGCQPMATNENGQYVLIGCTSTNIVPGVDYPAVYIWDQFANTFQAITRSTNGAQGTPSGAITGSLSADGRYVLFSSSATDLVAGGTTGTQVFVYDTVTMATTLVSSAADGTEATGDNETAGKITSDGRYAVFFSNSTNLVSGGGGGENFFSVYLKDLQTGDIEMVSAPLGVNTYCVAQPSISDDGQYVTFGCGNQNRGTQQIYLATMQ